MNTELGIVAVGARTPVGLTAESSAAAVRAGISRVREQAELVDRRGRPIKACVDARLAPSVRGVARLVALASPPLAAVGAAVAASVPSIVRLRVFLGVPEARPGWDDADTRQLVRQLGQLQLPGVGPLDIRAVESGHAAGLAAFEAASRSVALGEADVALAGGVDSHLAPATLDALDRGGRLATEDARSGFIPGEAAAFVAVASANTVRQNRLPVLAAIRGAHVTREARLVGGPEPVLGHCLAEAIHGALRGTSGISDVYCDLNGERYRSDEWQMALMRTQRSLDEGTAYVAPATSWGDVGAASGPLGMMLATAAWSRRYARGHTAIVWASSDRGLRAAVLLERAHA